MAWQGFSAFWQELRSDFRGGMPYVIWAVLTIIVGYAGPFGTYQFLPFGWRLLFWACIMALAIFVGISVRAFVHGALNLRSFRYGSTLIAAILAVIFPPMVTVVLSIPGLELTEVVPDQGELALFVFLASLGVGAYRHGRQRIVPPKDQKAYAFYDPVMPRLVQRLPEDVRGRLVSVSVRDHYIDVMTDAGEASLLMRLSDAVAETEPEEGAQVHRSHWVAWSAVTAAERSGNRTLLKLAGGKTIPVSRTYRHLLEARGIGIVNDDDPQTMAVASPPSSLEKIGSSDQRPPV